MSESTDLALPGSVSETGLDLPANLTFNEWRVAGETLGRIGRACQWWIGDWLNFGERAYGEKYTQAIEATGYELQSLTDFAWVSRQVEISRRHEILSYSHHREVASLGPAAQDRWLTAADANGWSKGQLRIRIRNTREVPIERECCPPYEPDTERKRQIAEKARERLLKTLGPLRAVERVVEDGTIEKIINAAISVIDPQEIEGLIEGLADGEKAIRAMRAIVEREAGS